jgi:hypothetical protein
MSPLEILAILALTAWAIYKQTAVAEVSGRSRFKMAIIYAAAGIAIGGFDLPSGAVGWTMIAAGLALSLVVGLLRGRYTRVWAEADGRVWRRGTALTVGLFVGLIAVKFALGALAATTGVDDGAGFGEVLVMIAIMIAVQAELIWRRALRLRGSRVVPTTAADALPAESPITTEGPR